MKHIIVFLLAALAAVQAAAASKDCVVDKSQIEVLNKLFSQKGHLYSLLWWSSPKSEVINARSFVINGRDSIPIFSSENEGKSQTKGSGYEKDLVGIDPRLLADVLQGMEYAILNPAGKSPLQFKTCMVKKYANLTLHSSGSPSATR